MQSPTVARQHGQRALAQRRHVALHQVRVRVLAQLCAEERQRGRRGEERGQEGWGCVVSILRVLGGDFAGKQTKESLFLQNKLPKTPQKKKDGEGSCARGRERKKEEEKTCAFVAFFSRDRVLHLTHLVVVQVVVLDVPRLGHHPVHPVADAPRDPLRERAAVEAPASYGRTHSRVSVQRLVTRVVDQTPYEGCLLPGVSNRHRPILAVINWCFRCKKCPKKKRKKKKVAPPVTTPPSDCAVLYPPWHTWWPTMVHRAQIARE
jgi:hypothetical protein